jgi:hypothetical protein
MKGGIQAAPEGKADVGCRETEMDALKRLEYCLIAAVVLVAIIAGIQSHLQNCSSALNCRL